MKAQLTMRTALALRMPVASRGLGRRRRLQSALLSCAGHAVMQMLDMRHMGAISRQRSPRSALSVGVNVGADVSVIPKNSTKPIGYQGNLAERGGFEPPMPLQACRISSAVRSTTPPPLHHFPHGLARISAEPSGRRDRRRRGAGGIISGRPG